MQLLEREREGYMQLLEREREGYVQLLEREREGGICATIKKANRDFVSSSM